MSAYDVIGDVHGYAGSLERLGRKAGLTSEFGLRESALLASTIDGP